MLIYIKTFIFKILLIFTLNKVKCENVNDFSEELLNWNGSKILGDNDLPYSNLHQLSQIEKNLNFKLKVIILTMNRPESLERLLSSINNTYFEYPQEKFTNDSYILAPSYSL